MPFFLKRTQGGLQYVEAKNSRYTNILKELNKYYVKNSNKINTKTHLKQQSTAIHLKTPLSPSLRESFPKKKGLCLLIERQDTNIINKGQDLISCTH